MGVAYDQAHPPQSSSYETPQELRPEGAVFTGAYVYPENLTVTGSVHTRRYHQCHVDHEETVTINRFMLSAALRRTLRSTNPIESAIEIAKTTARRVKRWQNGEQVLRWTAAGFKEAETRFRRVVGHREPTLLRKSLPGETPCISASEVANA